MTLTKEQKTQQARAIRDNKLLWELLTELDAGYVEGWKLAVDPDNREKYWHLQRALVEIQERLNDAIAEHATER